MTGYIPTQGCELLGAYRMAMALKDCVVMIHGPTGCHFGPNFLEVLTNNHSSNGTVSVMRDRSVIYGGIENLEKAIDITRKHYKDKKIIVLSSYIPSIIGDDPEFIDVDVYLDCGGFQPMWQGMEMFLEKLGDFVIREKAKAVDLSKTNLINLVGFQLDVAGGEEDLEEIKRVLALCNISANVIPDTLESLKYAKYASLNVVFGYGVKLAKRMERELGIPYVVVDYPYGVEGFKSFIEVISRHSNLKINHRVSDVIIDKLKKYRDNLPIFYEVPTCIVGDLPRISGLSRFLERELGMDVELALATSSAKENFDVSCTKLVNSYDEFYEELKSVPDIDVLLGTDEERRIRSDTIALAFPSFTRMSFIPYIGMGTLNLISDIYERVINKVWVK